MLDREEYIEQAHFFKILGERITENLSTQEVLGSIREEILATTKLPMAIDFMLAELKHQGIFAPAMKRMGHYFTHFQTYLIEEAESEHGRFDLRMALEILRREAEYRAGEVTPAGIFLFQFESICRNRLHYDRGLDAIASDPIFDASWRDWINSFRRRMGMAEVADLIYIASQHYVDTQERLGIEEPVERPILFGEREGRIALANRRKDPLLLFSALHRQLGYPVVPRPAAVVQQEDMLPSLARRMERVEQRIKLVEEELRGGIDLHRFYKPPEEGEP